MSSSALLDALSDAKVYDLGQTLGPNIPVSPNHPVYRSAFLRRHGDMVRADGGSAANDLFTMGTHVGTHMDALSHVSQDGKLFGGIDAHDNQVGGQMKQLGIETVPPIVCRGLLLDIAGSHGVATLSPGTAITADDLRRTAEREGVTPERGDAILVRSGWAANWKNSSFYIGMEQGVPGVDPSGAEQIARWGARITGHDSVAYEQIRPGLGHSLLPVHRILLVQHGIHIVENLDLDELALDRVYEFLFMVSPLKMVGATGSPVRPVALVVR